MVMDCSQYPTRANDLSKENGSFNKIDTMRTHFVHCHHHFQGTYTMPSASDDSGLSSARALCPLNNTIQQSGISNQNAIQDCNPVHLRGVIPFTGEKHSTVSQPWYYSERCTKETLEKAIADFLKKWKYPWVLGPLRRGMS